MTSKYITFSTKITVISFALCCGVVSQHVRWTFRDFDWLNSLQHFWFFMVETCVPFFFMISGCLFFRTYQSNKWRDKLESRAKTLLVPYVVWNVLYAIIMITLLKVGVVQNMQPVNSLSGGVISCFNSEFSPLWFVKYLMAFVCISPLMYYVLRNKWIGALTIVVLLLANAYHYYNGKMQVPLNVNANNYVMFIYQYVFFAIGSYAALCFKKWTECSSTKKSMLGIVLLCLLIISYWTYIVHKGDVITNHTFRWLWCIGVWFACDLLPEVRVRGWMKYAFFIYCSHLIFVMCFQGLSSIVYGRIGGMKPVLQISEYFWLPPLTIILLIKIGNILKCRTPQLWNLITGSRG